MWDERYDTDEYVYGKEANSFLVEHVDMLPQGKVLCLAEGEGRNAVFLAKKGFDVVAVDSSTVGLKKAERLALESGVAITTTAADLADFSIKPDSWDCIVTIFCHVPKNLRLNLHRRAVAGLKSGGILLLEAYTPEQLKHRTGGPPNVELMMTLSDLEREFEGLDIVLGREIERHVTEGRLHRGKGAVVQFIGRKK